LTDILEAVLTALFKERKKKGDSAKKMDFDHVGKLCSHPFCNRKDFLPFTCDACRKPFCLEHRSYLTHDCEVAKGRDMTSVDCPICGKSVVMSKAQDANAMWEKHYLTSCSQVATQSASSLSTSSSIVTAQKPKCARSGCNTTLGPSNTIQCQKCHKKLCIAHRMPEDHQCPAATSSSSGGNGNPFLQRLDGQRTSNSSKSKTPLQQYSKPSAVANRKSSAQPVDTANTLRGSAARRQRPASEVNSNSGYRCPFCNLPASSVEDLQSHIAIDHQEETPQSVLSSPEQEVWNWISCSLLEEHIH
jgi:predicted nucleic acid binding AN1-type Zn finger protein